MINEEYSFKDFTNKDLSSTLLTGTIKGSNFHSDGIDLLFCHIDSDANFVNCNIDNRMLPAKCTQEGCTNKFMEVQNDLEPWIIVDGSPTEPFRKSEYIRLGISIDPLDIPSTEIEKSIIVTTEKGLE
ncbi:MAG TPA: hypothetical protein ENK70_00540 [Methylophaga sp.]|nr:hypothetical protein [Methylophaga sp.]